VVERRRNPRRRAMARLAKRGEARSMDRVRRRVVVIDVTSGAVTRRVGVVAANMAFGACNRLMRSRELEDGGVIKGRWLPRRRGMTRLADSGESGSMDRVRCCVVIVQVTSGTVTRRVTIVSTNMAIHTWNGQMRPGELENGVVIEGRRLPCRRGMTRLADGGKSGSMDRV